MNRRPVAAGAASVAVALVAVFSASTGQGSGGTSEAATPLPDEQLAINDLEYRGAFRLSSDTFGDSDVNYAVGTLTFNPVNDSLFIAGHAQRNAVADQRQDRSCVHLRWCLPRGDRSGSVRLQRPGRRDGAVFADAP